MLPHATSTYAKYSLKDGWLLVAIFGFMQSTKFAQALHLANQVEFVQGAFGVQINQNFFMKEEF